MCSKKLKVLKTHTKTAATLEIGLVRIHETIKQCDSCYGIYRSDEPRKLIPHGCRSGFDVTDEIIVFLRRIKHCYGIPLALVHDMGAGILSAVKEVFPKVLDYICHYHFLRDIGNDLFKIEYARIRSELAKNSIRSSLRKIVKALEERLETQPEMSNSLDCYLKAEGKSGDVLPSVLAYILSNWVLDANSELDGYGFPFDRSHLVFYLLSRIPG
jgi:hypothetical protein